jgi:NAD-dependent DNA ligase
MIDDPAAQRAMANRRLSRASQVLNGIVAGVLADGELRDAEILMLRTWLQENSDVTAVWPGSAISKLLDQILADGVIDAAERAHLVDTLQRLCGVDFVETGAVAPEVTDLPFDVDVAVEVRDRTICFTGEFLYGTRRSCTLLAETAGAQVLNSVSRKVHYLIVGTHVSPNWITESYGRKIMQAVTLREGGHAIAIVPERHWLEAMGAS